MHLQNRALATSAITQQHFVHDGKKLGHLLDPRNAGYRPTPRDGAIYDSPAVLYRGHPIWGLTYRVLTVFFERLQLQIARPAP